MGLRATRDAHTAQETAAHTVACINGRFVALLVTRRAYWHIAEIMREVADEIERDAGKRSDYAIAKEALGAKLHSGSLMVREHDEIHERTPNQHQEHWH